MIPVLLEHNEHIGEVIKIIIETNCIKCLIAIYELSNCNYVSVGFRPIKFHYINGKRIITAIELNEVSLTNRPRQPKAIIAKRFKKFHQIKI